MKNLVKSTVYLAVFAVAGILFQISCSNSDSETKASVSQLNKLIYVKQTATDVAEIWTCNYDGTNQTLIPIALPSNIKFNCYTVGRSKPRLSPDGQTIFFVGVNSNNPGTYSLLSCDISGANLQEISVINGALDVEFGGAY